MKKLAMISSFCDTDEKKSVLKNNLHTLQSIGVDTLLLSPITLEEDIMELTTFYFKTSENPILTWPERANTFWWSVTNSEGNSVELHRDIDDYGWAAVYQMKKLSELAITFEYDIYYHMIYDLVIDSNVIHDIKNNVTNKTYHRINPKDNKHIWNVTLHFMILDRIHLEKLASVINKNDYIFLNGFAEDYVEKKIQNFDFVNSNFDVKDYVRYIDADDDNVFDYSLTKDYKIFFGKWDEEKKELGDFLWVVVYDIKNNLQVELITNTNEKFVMKNLVPIKVQNSQIESILVKTKFGNIDYSQIVKQIRRNVIKYKTND